MHGAGHILFIIGKRLLCRFTNRLQPGEMNHDIGPESGQAVMQRIGISQIGFMDFKTAV